MSRKCKLGFLTTYLKSSSCYCSFIDLKQNKNKYHLLIRFTTNEASRESETSIMIDRALEHQNKLHTTNKYMDDLLGQGSSILENLRYIASSLDILTCVSSAS